MGKASSVARSPPAILAAAFLLLGAPGACGEPLPLLFMAGDDAHDSWGLLYPRALPIGPVFDGDGTQIALDLGGKQLLAAFDPSPLRPADGYEVFFSNVSCSHDDRPGSACASSAVFFATTKDMRALHSTPVNVAAIGVVPGSSPANLSCYPKTIGRSANGSQYAMLMYCETTGGGPGRRLTEGARALVATDPTKPHAFAGPAHVAFHDHDDQMLLWDGPRDRWVASQITFQNWTTAGYRPTNATAQSLKFCDNAGCVFRRIGSARVSSDGVGWSRSSACNETFRGDPVRGQESFCTAHGGWNTSGILAPAAGLDPPELEIYKLSMFWVGDRLAGHALLYAPAPIAALGDRYGMTNASGVACGGTVAGLARCHAPHMYVERLIGPASGDPTDMAGWRRPFRRDRVAPRDAMLAIGPVHIAGQLAWPRLDDTAPLGGPTIPLFGVPEHRVAGLYAPANAEFSTEVLRWPGAPGALWLDVDAHWEQQPGGSCDEKCQAYVMVAVLDARTGSVIPGYERQKCVLFDVDATRHTLTWDGAPAAGIAKDRLVKLRVYFRDAVVYALGGAARG